MSCTSSSSSGMRIVGGELQLLLEVVDRRVVARGERRLVVRRVGHPLGQRLAELVDQLGRDLAVRLRRRVHAVDDHAAERHPRLAQLAVEEDRLLDRVVLRRGDDQERRRRVLEQRADPLGALGEAVDQPAERAEEHRQVLEQVDARDPLQQREHHAGAAPDDLAADPRRPQEHPDRAALEEAGQPPRRVEEVERVARRRRVEHQQVVVALLVELEQLRDRGELLRAGDRAGELLVDPVLEDLLARRVVRREPLDHLVERALGVEHHRPQLARSRSKLEPGAARCPARPSPARSRAAWPGRSSPPRPSSRARPSPSPARPTSWSCRRLPTPRR